MCPRFNKFSFILTTFCLSQAYRFFKKKKQSLKRVLNLPEIFASVKLFEKQPYTKKENVPSVLCFARSIFNSLNEGCGMLQIQSCLIIQFSKN